MSSTPFPYVALVGLATSGVLLCGCGQSTSASSPTTSTSATSASSTPATEVTTPVPTPTPTTASTPTPAPKPAAVSNPCKVIDNADMGDLLGVPFGGAKPLSGGGAELCRYLVSPKGKTFAITVAVASQGTIEEEAKGFQQSLGTLTDVKISDTKVEGADEALLLTGTLRGQIRVVAVVTRADGYDFLAGVEGFGSSKTYEADAKKIVRKLMAS